MKMILSAGPDLSVCLTDTNKLAIMVETDDGEHLAEVTDIDELVRKLRALELVQMEHRSMRAGSCSTTAEAELERRSLPCAFTHSHTRHFCGNDRCRDS